MRNFTAALLVAIGVCIATGCGGSSNKAADTTTAVTDTTTVAATTSTDTTASTDTSSTDTTTSTGGSSVAGLSAGCTKVADLSVEFGKALGAAGATGNGQTDLKKTAEAYKAFAAQVPEEIRGSFQTLAEAFGQYAQALKGVDLASGKTPDAATIAKLAHAAKALDNESLSAANTKIEAWVKKNCNQGG